MKFHYDCDPGQDDAIALMYALGGEDSGCQYYLGGVSVVGGNADVIKCARNALQILDASGCSIDDTPVYVGADRPMYRALETLPNVFGESGMAGAEGLSEPGQKVSSVSALDALRDLPDQSVIVATGPLTNLALAIQQDRTFAARIGKLVVMGGCAYPEHIHGRMGNYFCAGGSTNQDGWAEYNFAVDPEAARIVFQSGIQSIDMIGVNITRTVLYNSKIDQALRQSGNRCSVLAANILSTVGSEDIEDYAACRMFEGDPVRGIHDVVAMFYLFYPEFFRSKVLPLRIEDKHSGGVAGQTLIDPLHYDHKAVRVIIDLDRKAFLDSLVRHIAHLP